MAKKPDMADTTNTPPNTTPAAKPAGRLFLSAGHGGHDPGACANGLTEAALTTPLRDGVKRELLALGVDPARIITDADNWDFPTTLDFFLHHCLPQDTVLEIHFNSTIPPKAQLAWGTETYVKLKPTPADIALADSLSASVSAVLGTANRGRKPEDNSQHPSLAVLHYTGTACLLEVEFITQTVRIQTYLAKQAQVAKAIAAVLYAKVFAPHA